MYVGEWRPGVLERVMFAAGEEGHQRMRRALTVLAQAAERRTKNALAQTSHPYGTPTASSPGSPPSLISGTLRRSITHDRIISDGVGWATKIGTAAGFYPPYPPLKDADDYRTRSSLYGFYLETGLRNGATYPFLVPSVRAAIAVDGPAIWQASFRGTW